MTALAVHFLKAVTKKAELIAMTVLKKFLSGQKENNYEDI